MKRIIITLTLALALVLAGAFNQPTRAQGYSCIGQCQDESVIFAQGCVAGGGSETQCSQLAYQYLLDCYVDCVVP